ncbi:sugar 3,4-ketoisomerase [Labilibacter marinus]|uniref:sugar 3,4-ketoisomerase n=1 Tax=Labilibacter marinus TaxID=1477105 RepID=UPI00082FA3B9|nr:FdtA/QdtA family cupin domain-containing protein [Labilibacter marinus]
MANIEDCKIITLPKIPSEKGSLSFAEAEGIIPFDIKRVYFTYDIPAGAERGGHAHKNLSQLIVAASGSFNIIINDGKKEKTIFLNNPRNGLIIHSGIWREINEFSSGSIVLVIASELYSEDDYIRDFIKFKNSIC